MKSLKVVFRDGAFIPTEPISIPEGTEGIVVYVERSEKTPWWNILPISDEKKGAVKLFSENLKKRVVYRDVKVVVRPEGFEVFVLVEDETSALKPAMEEALRVYEETGIYLPIQVISKRRLDRWRQMESPIYREIEEGISVG